MCRGQATDTTFFFMQFTSIHLSSFKCSLSYETGQCAIFMQKCYIIRKWLLCTCITDLKPQCLRVSLLGNEDYFMLHCHRISKWWTGMACNWEIWLMISLSNQMQPFNSSSLSVRETRCTPLWSKVSPSESSKVPSNLQNSNKPLKH